MSQITIRVKNQSSQEVFFKVKMDIAMGKVFKAYAKKTGVQVNELRFLLDGERVKADATPKSLELEDQDQIDVVLEQTGGC
eukprot:g769.t1